MQAQENHWLKDHDRPARPTLSEPPSSLHLKQAHCISITFLPKLHHNGLAIRQPSRNFIGIKRSSIRGIYW
uniref:Uncharacterized protein n=1 Tax=Populus trichocarpa TaxID=3694 RepID=A0A2K1Z8S3_POPTR